VFYLNLGHFGNSCTYVILPVVPLVSLYNTGARSIIVIASLCYHWCVNLPFGYVSL